MSGAKTLRFIKRHYDGLRDVVLWFVAFEIKFLVSQSLANLGGAWGVMSCAFCCVAMPPLNRTTPKSQSKNIEQK